jgi:hypothetical protein
MDFGGSQTHFADHNEITVFLYVACTNKQYWRTLGYMKYITILLYNITNKH